MPAGKGTYGSRVGRPKKRKPMKKKPAKKGGKKKGLTAKQKKLPMALQKAILKRRRGK
jgi:hypothetical protein